MGPSISEHNRRTINFTENVADRYLFIDRELIYNSVYNLLINAFKFTPFEGTIEISVKEDLNSIFITITDSGIGISEVDIPKIFNLFGPILSKTDLHL